MAEKRTPPLPAGFATFAPFGTALGWGSYDAAARRRAAQISLSEVRALGITTQIAEAWMEFYRAVVMKHPDNPSARGRAELMQRIIEILEAANE